MYIQISCFCMLKCNSQTKQPRDAESFFLREREMRKERTELPVVCICYSAGRDALCEKSFNALKNMVLVAMYPTSTLPLPTYHHQSAYYR